MAAFTAFHTYDSSDIKELEFKRVLAQQRKKGSCEDQTGWQPCSATATWCPTSYTDSSWNGLATEVEDCSSTYMMTCQRCGSDAPATKGDFDPAVGLWYCIVCWRQCQLMQALSSDEEDSDDEDIHDSHTTACGSTRPCEVEDDVCTVGSTRADTSSSGESDIDSGRGEIVSSPKHHSKIRMRPSADSWAARMRLRRELRSESTCADESQFCRKLQPSATSWAAQMKTRRQSSCGSDDASKSPPGDLARSTRALLNKLTPESFERLCRQMINLVDTRSDSREHIEALSREIFTKAVNDHSFCALYSDLCVRLDAHLGDRVAELDDVPSLSSCLQGECQASFDHELCAVGEPACVDGLEGDALYEMEVKLKRARIGTIRFMGELFNRGMLPACTIMSSCKQLLGAPDGKGAAIESLVAMLHVISPRFDSFDASLADALRSIYTELRCKTKSGQLPSRIQFLLRDLLDATPKSRFAKTPVKSPLQEIQSRRQSSVAVWKPRRHRDTTDR